MRDQREGNSCLFGKSRLTISRLFCFSPGAVHLSRTFLAVGSGFPAFEKDGGVHFMRSKYGPIPKTAMITVFVLLWALGVGCALTGNAAPANTTTSWQTTYPTMV